MLLIYVCISRRRKLKNQKGRHGRDREEKADHSFINSKKIEKIEREEKREKRNPWFHTMPTYLPVQYLLRGILSFVSSLGFHIPLSYRHTDRSRPTFCLYLALTYMDLFSRTVLSVELDEIQNTDTM